MNYFEKVPTTLDEVREHERWFPKAALYKCESALCLFAAGFYGANVEIHIEEAGMQTVTCVDNDEVKLQKMKEMYPDSWDFVCADVFKFDVKIMKWDVVILDPPMHLFTDTYLNLKRWTSFARNTVICGVLDAHLKKSKTPITSLKGWKPAEPFALIPRNDVSSWLILDHS